MAVGRISGPLLKSNLVRNGIDLAFETDLLYLDVNNSRVGIRTANPTHDLHVNGTARTSSLTVDNSSDLADVNISGNTIKSTNGDLNLVTTGSDYVVTLKEVQIDDINIVDNNITTTVSNANLELRPNGTGSVEALGDMNVSGNIHATGNISADGNIQIGDANTDSITFNADITSNIVPDVDDTYTIGTTDKRWNNIWVNRFIAESIDTGDLNVDGVNLSLRQGNIIYVATNGEDTNTGTHPNDPVASVETALTLASAGDTIHIYPGVYEESFPLEVPAGVAVVGEGIRSVLIQPVSSDPYQDAFLLNGETTIENLTVGNFYYDNINDRGYAFKFAPGFTVSSRSPYIRNVTILTQGSVTTTEDPRGFNSGDAGRGAYLDGSVASPTSKEASCLFHSITFICPNTDGVFATNGVRIEWLNSFTYFSDYSIRAISGSLGIKGNGKTALRVNNVTGTFSAGETVSYYDVDGTTLLASGTIEFLENDKIFIDGKSLGFELPSDRGGKTVTANGNAQLSTTEKKFGTASLALDGTGDYVSSTPQDDFGFGTGDFTVEFWYYQTAGSGTRALADFRSAATQESIYIGTTSAVPFLYINGSFVINSSATLSNGQWYHIAVSRSGTTARLFVNGTDTGSATVSNDLGSSRTLNIGANYLGTSAYVSGYFDDLRIIKGVAEYTANFTAPQSQLPVTDDTVLMLRFDGNNGSTEIEDDVVYAQDIRFSGGATATKFDLVDYSDFGAEIRLIASASVYGNYGLYGDGAGVIMYAIGHNLAYIGNGKEVTNDPTTVLQANEVTQLNGAKIYFSSVDHKGDFRVGDLFYVNQQTGAVEFTNADFTINTQNGLIVTDGSNTTTIEGDKIDTGNLRISGNTIESLSGDVNLNADSDQINLNNNVNITGNLDVTGDVTIGGNITIGDEATDSISFVAGIDSSLIPNTTETHSLGTPTLGWKDVYVNRAIIDSIEINDNLIQTTESNADLELRANGTGEIVVPSNDFLLEQDLTVVGTTTLGDTVLVGDLLQTGNTVQVGNYSITGNVSVTGTIDVGSTAQFENIQIDQNTITTTDSNSDLELEASGTGRVYIPNNNVVIENDLTINGEVNIQDLTSNTTVNVNSLSTGDILIDDNFITTTLSNSNLELRANGTGTIYLPTNDLLIDQDLTVNGLTTLENTNITGTLTHVGNSTITGNYTVTGDFTTDTLNVNNDAQFADILISQNNITTTIGSNNLNLSAAGAGNVVFPTNDVNMQQNLDVVGTVTAGYVDISNTAVATTFSTGNIDITDNVIQTTVSNSNLELRANGTGNVVVEGFEFSSNTISSGNVDLIFEPGTGKIVSFNSTQSLRIPVGTTLERPATPEQGMVRFNTDINYYEGYNGTTWIRLHGLSDADGDTYVTAELTPGANDNTIRFYVENTQVADINSIRLNANRINVGDLEITDDSITNLNTNGDITLNANGTGSILFENFEFNNNTIRNTVNNSVTVFEQTGSGYVKIDGTTGFVIPYGGSGSRPAAPVLGLTRFNTELQQVEVYDGTSWVSAAGSSGAVNAATANEIAVETVLMLG